MNVRQLRKKLKLSQQELADQTGIPKGRIGQWELGNGKPKYQDHDILTKFFVKNGVMERKENEIVESVEFDIGAAVKRIQAESSVTLFAVAELLALARNQPTTVVVEQLEDLVRSRLRE